MGYAYWINSYKSNKDQITITFPKNTYSYSNKPADGLIETKGVLQFCGFVNGNDFAVDQSANEITVAGRANIIVALNVLLSRKDMFYYSAQSGMGSSEYWAKRMTALAVEAICDKELKQGELEKILPITREFLDASFKNLQALPQYDRIKADVKMEYGDNVLRHPLYQALSLIIDDYDKQAEEYQAYKKTPWLKRRNLPTKIEPDHKAYQAIFDGFKVAVPPVYLLTKGSGFDKETFIDKGKIRASTQAPVNHLRLMK